MIKSMTGYGRAEQVLHGRDITVEIRSVNHRYFEFTCRTPRSCAYLEDKLKKQVQASISRGKVDVGLTIQTVESENSSVQINHTLAAEYLAALRTMGSELGLKDDVTLSCMTRFSDIFTVCRGEDDEDEVWQDVSTVLTEAITKFVEMREIEGERLRTDVQNRLIVLEDHVSYIEDRSPETVAEYRRRLTQKLNDLLGGAVADENRILTEAAIVADRLAVDEETVRLRSHFAQVRDILASNDPVGRKLDFLVQEMNREANTIGSKCNDTAISKHVVELKSEIEKIREQIQNIE